jgi:hypothetical protein
MHSLYVYFKLIQSCGCRPLITYFKLLTLLFRNVISCIRNAKAQFYKKVFSEPNTKTCKFPSNITVGDGKLQEHDLVLSDHDQTTCKN